MSDAPDRVVNLDEFKDERDTIRAAQAEVENAQPRVVFKDTEFLMPVELPFKLFVKLDEMRDKKEDSIRLLHSLLVAMFGDRTDEFLDLNPSMDDINTLIDKLFGAYGIDVGELEASPSS